MTAGKQPPLWALLLAFCVGLGLLFYASVPLHRWANSRGWPNTAGTVVSSKLKTMPSDSGGEATYHAQIVYEYMVDGQAYRGNRPLFGYKASSDHARHRELCRHYPAGRQVTVFFDPLHPEEAVLDRDVDWLVVVTCLFLGLLALGAALYNVFRRAPAEEFPELADAQEPLARHSRGILSQLAKQKVHVRTGGPAAVSIVVGRGRSKMMIQAAGMAALLIGFFLFALLSVESGSVSRFLFLGILGLLELFFVLWLLDLLLVAKEIHARGRELVVCTRLGPIRWSKVLKAADIAGVTYTVNMSSGEIRYFDIRATLKNQREIRLAHGILGEDRAEWLTRRIQECLREAG